MKKIFGFTLSELMIAFVILGVLCAVVMPMVVRDNPSQNKMMMKRAYYSFSEAVSTLINDIDIDFTIDEEGYCSLNKQTGYVGFDCLGTTGTKTLPYKFSRLFNLEKRISETQMEVNSLSSLGGLCAAVDSSNSCYSVKTSDKLVWVFPVNKNFEKGNLNSSILVGVDVNSTKAPNCYQGSTTNSCKNRNKNFDQLLINLYADGGIQIAPKQCWAEMAISVSSAITDTDECTNEDE